MPIVAWGQTALTMEIPAPAMTHAAVVTLPRCRESHGIAARCPPERHGPASEVILPGAALIVARKRVS
jgi:hypothetical protein